jgi:hypothetical protein
MQLIKLTLSHDSFYCPATGTPLAVGDEPINDDAPSYKGYWLAAYLDSPGISDQELERAYENFLNEEGISKPSIAQLEAFLKNYDAPNWVVFCIRSPSGLDYSTVYHVMDMDVQ